MTEIQDKASLPYTGAEHQLTSGSKRSYGWMLWAGLFLLLAAGVAFYLYSHKAAPKPAKAAGAAVTITTATAKKGDIGVYLSAIGTVTPVYTSSITAQASGIVTEVHYREGQTVAKGAPLIDIDPRPYQATLLQAQGVLERDTNVLAQAQMDVERYRTAWARNAIPKQTLDDQEKLVLQDQGTVKNDQGTVNYDQVQLSYCHITAPISGRVGLRLVDPGNVVQANGSTILVVITQMQPTTVIFTLPEDSLDQVQGQMRKKHTLAVEALDRSQTTKLATGKLFTIDNQIDPTTGTVKLRALFDNRDNALFPNQFVNTRLLVDTQKGVTLIPTAAIQHNGQDAFVFVAANDQVSERKITTGTAEGGMTAVQGINPGDVVATSSFDKLQSGSKVVEAKQAPATRQAPATKSAEGSAP